LITKAIRPLAGEDDAIAMIPNRDTLLIAGSENNEALSAMLEQAKEALKQSYPNSGVALRLSGDEWVPWLPAESHPLYGEFHALQLSTFRQEHDKQKAMLEDRNRESGENISVAKFDVSHTADGAIFSVAEWERGADTLLPKTDKILFCRADAETMAVSWEVARRVVGSLMEPLGIYPPRYHVRSFPTEEQLAWMASED
jgi:hypothetical protein